MRRNASIIAVLLATTVFPAAASTGSFARLSIIDRTAGIELPVHWKDGQAWVEGRPGNEYQVRVRSTAGEDLLAIVSVDGINVLSGETANPSQGGYVLSPWRSMDIAGWRKSLDNTAAFYFTSLGDSYAGRTGRPANVGVIGVALFQRKAEPPVGFMAPSPYAKDEARAPSAGASREESAGSHAKRAAPSAPLATGHGRIEHNPARWTSFERATSRPVETLTIRYDSRRNLVAMGVIEVPRREPDAFPGFVPDPVARGTPWRGHRGG